VATVVAFHAHPDDEVLLTGGTIAKLAEQGHRVVVVMASDGDMGTDPSAPVGARLEEFRASVAVLGADKALHLGYADSGHGSPLLDDPPGRIRFVRADVEEAAGKLAAILEEEQADLLISYDAQGGYGHRDHVQVHRVGARAAELTGIRVVEATIPRELVARAALPLVTLRLVRRHRLTEMQHYGTPKSAITQRIDVRRYAARKQQALSVHRTPLYSTGRGARLFRFMVRLPAPLFRLVAGREWFAEPGEPHTPTDAFW
jgi:LmbE family N-acetylglucosaminyl deacetylase